MSVKPEYAEKILTGSKLVEIEKKLLRPTRLERELCYMLPPSEAIVGEAVVANITFAAPEEIWEKFGEHIGCSLEDFLSYVGAASKVSAIEFEDVFHTGKIR